MDGTWTAGSCSRAVTPSCTSRPFAVHSPLSLLPSGPQVVHILWSTALRHVKAPAPDGHRSWQVTAVQGDDAREPVTGAPDTAGDGLASATTGLPQR